MINRIKNKNTILFLIVFILSIGINIKGVNAVPPDATMFAGTEQSDNDGNGPSDGENGYTGGGSGSGGWIGTPAQGAIIYNCNISRSSSSYSTVYGNKYDILGNKYRLDDKSIKTLAGTYIGINIYEKKGYTKTGSYKVEAKKVNYVCTYYKEESFYVYGTVCPTNSTNSSEIIASPLINNNKKYYIRQTRVVAWDDSNGGGSSGSSGNSGNTGGTSPKPQLRTCTRKVEQTFTPEDGAEGCPEKIGKYTVSESRADKNTTPSSSEISNCKNRATPSHSNLTGSYKVTYKDSNDIDETAGTTATITGSGSCTTGSSSSGGGSSGSISISKDCTFSYNREKTCINIQTSKVRYISTSEKCDSTTEYTITMKNGYWKYFIPLNANSKNGFSLSMNPNSASVQSIGLCQNIIDNYDNYRDLIKPAKGSFTANETKNQAKNRIAAANGCYYQSTITIPIEQKFYNELDDGSTFNGFNFYYKTIDVDDPFPNTLPTYSIWKEQEKNNKKIEFGSITYEADMSISNIQKIRTYNQSNLYTSWLNMKNKGNTSISQFIEKEKIVVRLQNNDSYKLGCGPSNTNLEITNPFYQKECVKS